MINLEDLLQQCTVKLTLPNRTGWGTGFFVTPDLILTCAHVVRESEGKPFQVRWQNQESWAEAVVEKLLPDPYDFALLRVTLSQEGNPPCVYLDCEVQSRDPLYLFGYPDQDFPNGCPVTLICEGLTGDKPALIKFALGQVRPGMSGSPLLNQRTGKVCGIVKFTRDRSFDLGGGAIAISTVFSQFPELEAKNHQFQPSNHQWTAFLPPLVIPNQHERDTYKNRQRLLNKVKNFWIRRILENSLYSRSPIELHLEQRFDVLGLNHETPELSKKSLPKGAKAINIFDELGAGRTLLILGSPGSGKTTTLLEIAQILVNRAEQNRVSPIPVIFNLSSWSGAKQKMKSWLIQELYTNYQVSKPLGKSLVEEQQLLLLLDGLDEIKAELREIHIQAINQFCIEYGHTEIVVCSRIEAYKALYNRLHFQGAIFISPLRTDQVSDYLDQAESPLAEVKLAIQQDSMLQELAQTPLMLSIMTLAYQDVPATKLHLMGLEDGRRYLFDRYIDRMFERRKGECPYSEEQMRCWLSFLAQKMVQESQSFFLIENIASSWLQPDFQRWIYLGAVGIISGLIVEFIGLIVGLMAGSLSGEMFFGLVCGVMLGLSSELFKPSKFLWFETEIWKSIAFILAIGTFLGFTGTLIGKQIGVGVGELIPGAFYGLMISSIVAFVRIFVSLTKPSVQKTTRLNQKTWQAFTNSLTISLIAFCLIIFPTVFLLTTPTRISLAALLGAISLLSGGLISIQHLMLRLFIWWDGKAPWNYDCFLNWADRQFLLQRVGVSYQFPHNLLREHWQKNTQQFLQYLSPRQWLAKMLIVLSFVSLLTVSLTIPLAIDTIKVSERLAMMMSPIVQKGDRLIINKFIYNFSKPQLGDVVLYNSSDPSAQKRLNLKQIAGLSGQSVEVSGRIPPNSYLLIAVHQTEDSNETMRDIVHRNQIIGKMVLRYWANN
jgi:signal peptidase I/DNA polymerase III delta prime subunit